MKQHFLQLAQTYSPKKHGIGGFFISEKYDGQRSYWDGGITKGMPKSEVPWANTSKDGRYVVKQYATGLWSRYGHIIHCPDWWSKNLPPVPLDGELFSGNFQETMSITRTLVPTSEWQRVKYMVFDSPPISTIYASRRIDETNYKKTINCVQWALDQGAKSLGSEYIIFKSTYKLLTELGPSGWCLVPQEQLPYPTKEAETYIADYLATIVAKGGEGIVIRDPDARYATERSHSVLKYKPYQDDEGVVVGYVAGKGKLEGLFGAMIVKNRNNQRFELSGFTDEERRLLQSGAVEFANKNPGERLPDWVEARYFPLGTVVTYKYRELTNDGLPKEARYWRKV